MEEVAEWTRLTDQVKQNVKELNLRMDRMQEVEDGRYIYRIVREMVTPPGFLPGLIVLADDTIRLFNRSDSNTILQRFVRHAAG